jgi:hypothetical protein
MTQLENHFDNEFRAEVLAALRATGTPVVVFEPRCDECMKPQPREAMTWIDGEYFCSDCVTPTR